jgi:hypothetical protein
MKLLEGWDNFYVILGSAAAALIGLTFVVIALLSDGRRTNRAGLEGYIKPTIVHFGCVLAYAAYLSMPGHTVFTVSLGLGAVGLGTVLYSAMVARNVRRFATEYVPLLADWAWHVLLPTGSYAALLGTSVLVWYRLSPALYLIAAALLALLFIGIHNALDVAVSVTMGKGSDRNDAGPKA